jgi:hypothetical protein
MAQNQKFGKGDQLMLTVASGVTAGDPCAIGASLMGIALNDRGTDATGKSTVKFSGVFTLSVKGTGVNGDIAIAIGDPVYFTNADTPKLNAKATGMFVGFALGAVVSGATTSIDVLILPASAPKSILKMNIVTGGAAGNLTLTGIAPGDRIVSVLVFTTAASIATGANLTSEFLITAADTINNTAGTSTASNLVIVFWEDRT